MDNITTSLFGIAKRGGWYASEKQASFLLSHCGNDWIVNSSVSFGEYDGRTSRNTRSVQWAFALDNEGVKEITKNGKVWFVRQGDKDCVQQAISDKKAWKELYLSAVAIVREVSEQKQKQGEKVFMSLMMKKANKTGKKECSLDLAMQAMTRDGRHEKAWKFVCLDLR